MTYLAITATIALATLFTSALLASRYRLALHERDTLRSDVVELKRTIIQLSDLAESRR